MGTGSLRNDTNIHPQPSSYAQLQQALSVMQKKQKKPCSEGERVSRSLTSTVQSAFHSHLRCNRIPSCSLVKMSTGHVWKLVMQRDMVGVSVGGVWTWATCAPSASGLWIRHGEAPVGESGSCWSVLKVHLLPGLFTPGLQLVAERNREIWNLYQGNLYYLSCSASNVRYSRRLVFTFRTAWSQDLAPQIVIFYSIGFV